MKGFPKDVKLAETQYPRVSEEHESLSSPLGIASALSTGLLVDTNLETSILDIYRPPPSPIPYDANQRCPLLGNQEFSGNKSEGTVRTTGTEPVEATNTIITHESTKMPNKSEGEVQTNIELASLKELEEELEKFGELKKFSEPIVSELEEEVVYPTFLEGGSSAFDTAIFILSVGYAIRHIAPNIIWTVGSWTAYLISVLYVEYRTKKEKENVNFKNHVIQIIWLLNFAKIPLHKFTKKKKPF